MSASSALAGFNFTFDDDNESWTRGNLGSTHATITTNSSGAAVWDAGGWLQGSDHSGYAFHFSPDLGGGHGNLFGNEISLDFRTQFAGGNNPFLVLVSSDSFLVKLQTHQTTSDFVHYSYTLDSTDGWYYNSSPYYNGANAVLASDAQIQAVLDDLRHLGVSTDIGGGADNTWTDNVKAVPEPATLSLLALAALAAKRRKKA